MDYQKLAEKFTDKGYIQELHWFVLPPPIFLLNRIEGTREQQKKFFDEAVQKVYGEDWDYWNTWIDYQKHK